MNREQLVELLKQNGITREVIGYERDLNTGFIFPTFKPKDNPHDEPTMGGLWFYDPANKQWNTMLLSDFLDITEIETVVF